MIRIHALELRNVKNVEHGIVDVPDSGRNASILGIYGQNGSGKTAAIDALSCVKALVSGKTLPEGAVDLIARGDDECSISVTWSIDGDSMRKLEVVEPAAEDDAQTDGDPFAFQNAFATEGGLVRYDVRLLRSGEKALVAGETLTCKVSGMRERTLIRHEAFEGDDGQALHAGRLHGQSDEAESQSSGLRYAATLSDDGSENDMADVRFEVSPQKWGSLKAVVTEAKKEFELAELMAYHGARSFVFSQQFFGFLDKVGLAADVAWREGSLSKAAEDAFASVLGATYVSVYALNRHAVLQFFVEGTMRGHAAGSNKLVVDVMRRDGHGQVVPSAIALDLMEATPVLLEDLDDLEFTFSAISEVLSQLVPGLSVYLERRGPTKLDGNRDAEKVLVMSRRGDVEILFSAESEGIRKLVSVLVMLIRVYNDDEACVVIDELDASIFEFLLGELLDVLSRYGKGQLIFTAHNLRPLETLPYQSIVVTTTNPSERYARFHGVKPTNNVRDMYLKLVNLGGDGFSVYNPTSVPAISGALYDAAHPIGEASFENLLSALGGNDE